jgi:hypothetical protein
MSPAARTFLAFGLGSLIPALVGLVGQFWLGRSLIDATQRTRRPIT